MNELAIKEINVFPIKGKNGFCSLASAVINEQLFIGNLALYTCPSSPDGFRLVWPTKTLSNGTQLPIVYPINRITGFAIQKQVVGCYLKLIEDLAEKVNGTIYDAKGII